MTHDNAFALYMLGLFIVGVLVLMFGGEALIRQLEKHERKNKNDFTTTKE